MNRFIGPESKLYEALSLFADLVVINLLMVATSWPVVTGGLSLRAGHRVLGAMAGEEGSKPAATFVRGLLVRPAGTTAWWLASLAVAGLGAYELWVISRAGLGEGMALVLRAAVLSGLLVWAGITVWFFHGDDAAPLRRRVLTAAWGAVAHLPRTALALLPWLALVAFPLVFPAQLGAYVFFVIVIGPALAVYLSELALTGLVRQSPGTE